MNCKKGFLFLQIDISGENIKQQTLFVKFFFFFNVNSEKKEITLIFLTDRKAPRLDAINDCNLECVYY